MSRYIDADVAINLAKEEIDSGTPNDIVWKLEALPAADVVEAVRCRDCKHRPIIIEEEEIDGFSYEFPDYKCPCRCEDGFFSWNPDDDWFCANGEKEGKMARIH